MATKLLGDVAKNAGPTVEFVGQHPIAATVGFVTGTTAGYMVAHKGLDIDRGPALITGLVTGVVEVAVIAYLWSYIPTWGGTASVLAPLAKPFVPIVDKVFGPSDTTEFKKPEDVKSGEPSWKGNHNVDSELEAKAFWAYMQDPKNKVKQQAFYDAVQETHKDKS